MARLPADLLSFPILPWTRTSNPRTAITGLPSPLSLAVLFPPGHSRSFTSRPTRCGCFRSGWELGAAASKWTRPLHRSRALRLSSPRRVILGYACMATATTRLSFPEPDSTSVWNPMKHETDRRDHFHRHVPSYGSTQHPIRRSSSSSSSSSDDGTKSAKAPSRPPQEPGPAEVSSHST